MVTPSRTRVRPSLAAEDRDLAQQVGDRLKAARKRAGLTQRELAEPRYTKAYISALENGLIKPSMAALRFLARRLGTVPAAFLADEDTHWHRLDAEIRLAAGDWQAAADAFEAILAGEPAGVGRGLCLVGLAEASFRLGQAKATIGYATEARELLKKAHRDLESMQATYWLALGHLVTGESTRAHGLLEELVAVTDSLTAATDLRARSLIALAAVTSGLGDPTAALGLLEEAKRIGAALDDRRRGVFQFSLAQSYRTSGDLEGAIRAGTESLSLFRAMDARSEVAAIENELALTYLDLGNLAEARRHVVEARVRLEAMRDPYRLAAVAGTEARIELTRGSLDEAERLAMEAAGMAAEVNNGKALVDALLTLARATRARGDLQAAVVALDRAEAAAADGPPAQLRHVLTERSELVAESGDHATAYKLSRRALDLT